MIPLYEAFMRCRYCGTRMLQRLRPDEATALANGKLARRHCESCVGSTEWEVLEWKSAPPHEASSSAAPDRILVIDDDDLTVSLLRKVLEAEECVLEVASDGREALEKIMGQRYSLVLCDIHMPNLDGKKLFRVIEDQEETRKAILFVTGDTSEETREFLEETGCPYMYKPIQVMKLASMTREILDANRRESGKSPEL